MQMDGACKPDFLKMTKTRSEIHLERVVHLAEKQ